MEENNNYSPENITLKLNIYPDDTTESDKFTVKSNCTDVVKVELDPSSTEEDIKYKFIPQHPGQTLVVTKATDGSMTTNELVVNVTSSRPIEVNNLTYYRDSSLDKKLFTEEIQGLPGLIWPYKAHAFYGDTRIDNIIYTYNTNYNIFLTRIADNNVPQSIILFGIDYLELNKSIICQMIPNHESSTKFNCNILLNESKTEDLTDLINGIMGLRNIYDYEVITISKVIFGKNPLRVFRYPKVNK